MAATETHAIVGGARLGTASAWPAGTVLRLLHTENRYGPTVLRVVLGLVMFPHGAQHALGWFGGYGFAGTLEWMSGTVGYPIALSAFAIVIELVAPILLVLGMGGRVAALGIGAIMLGAIPTHLHAGFFMNWYGQLPPGTEGFEFHILALAMAAALVLTGSGAWSIDRVIGSRSARGR